MIRRYDNYKDSGVEWIGEIPEGWSVKKFKYLYLSSMGSTILKADLETNGEIPVYSATESDAIFGYINNAEIMLEKGDIVIPARGNSIGHIMLVNERATCTQTTIYAKKYSPLVDDRFSFYFLKGLRNHLFQFDQTAIPQITVAQVKENPVVLPHLSEQTAIASFLDHKIGEIDQLIANKEKLIALYEEEKTVIINLAVTKGLDPAVKTKPSGVDWLADIPEHWQVKRLKYVKAEVKNSFVDGPFGSHLKSEHFVNNGDVYVIDSGYITSGDFQFHKEFKTITKEHYETIQRSECVENDIIIAKIGANFGMSGILPKLDKPSVVSGNSLKLTIGKGFYLKYIHYQLLNLKQLGVIDVEVKGSAQPALSMQLISEMPFLKTTEEEQIAIVAYIETEYSRLDTIIEKFKKQIELFKEYRTTLITEVVTGKIDVRDEVKV